MCCYNLGFASKYGDQNTEAPRTYQRLLLCSLLTRYGQQAMLDYAGSRASQKQPSQGLALARVEADPDRVHTGDSSAAVGSGAVVWQRLCLRVVELPSWLHQFHCCHEHGIHSCKQSLHCKPHMLYSLVVCMQPSLVGSPCTASHIRHIVCVVPFSQQSMHCKSAHATLHMDMAYMAYLIQF